MAPPPLDAPGRRGGGWGLSLALKSFYSQSLVIDAVTFMCVGYVDGTDYSEYILTIDVKEENCRLDNAYAPPPSVFFAHYSKYF